MYHGFGRGQGNKTGMGFGFQGSSPPWPYVGRGRGGLPHCQYPGLSRLAFTPTSTELPKEDKISLLKSQVEATKRILDDMENRLRDLSRDKTS
jgi:hypothetical protein